MPSISLTPPLRTTYQELFASCVIRDNREQAVADILQRMKPNRNRYTSVGGELDIPWYVVAVIHNMEASLNFSRHLHNGDPLTRRTTHIPRNRPRTGTPPFTWEESAIDALKLRKLHQWDDWSIAGTLYQLEAYNGWGYRLYHSHVLSPYLWSFSTHYQSGKYVADGSWSDSAVSRQCGAAVLLRRMVEQGIIQIPESADTPRPRAARAPLRYSPRKVLPDGKQLQTFLNQFPGIYLKVDGLPGARTSDAFKTTTGYYLKGDPRA